MLQNIVSDLLLLLVCIIIRNRCFSISWVNMQMMKVKLVFVTLFSSLVCCRYFWSLLLHSYPAGASRGLRSLLE